MDTFDLGENLVQMRVAKWPTAITENLIEEHGNPFNRQENSTVTVNDDYWIGLHEIKKSGQAYSSLDEWPEPILR